MVTRRLKSDQARELSDAIAVWAEAEWPDADVAAKFRKLGEEYGELGEALIHGESVSIIQEAGDCMVVLAHILHMQGLPDFIDVMNFVFRERVARDDSAHVREEREERGDAD